MNNINIGDLVTRKSYNEDILFRVINIIDDIYYLRGVNIRIYADALQNDLVIKKDIRGFIEKINKRENNISNIFREIRSSSSLYKFGKILHIDGDDRYARKTLRYYKKSGLPCSVYSIEERKQSKYIRELLLKERPDILIITGHDSLAKNGSKENINSYKNSRYFRDSVIQARMYQSNRGKLAIFAGACQSYYEELMNSGANFASSPGRILIDFFDPLIVAHILSITDRNSIIGMSTIVDKIKDGYKSINGVPTFGKAQYI